MSVLLEIAIKPVVFQALWHCLDPGFITFHICNYSFCTIFEDLDEIYLVMYLWTHASSRLAFLINEVHRDVLFCVLRALACPYSSIAEPRWSDLWEIAFIYKGVHLGTLQLSILAAAWIADAFQPSPGTMAVLSSWLLCHSCREPIISRWRTRTFIFQTVKWQLISWESFQHFLTLLCELVQSICWISGQFDALSNSDKDTLWFRALWNPTVYSVLTGGGEVG